MAPKARAAHYKAWCYTLNNPTVPELRDLWCWNESHAGPVPNRCELLYTVIGYEQGGRENTVHLQGYVELGVKVRLAQLHRWFPRCHWEPLNPKTRNPKP